MTNNEAFFQKLKDIGLFVRDYDRVCQEELPKAVSTLHSQICCIGQTADLHRWLELPLGKLLEAYAKGTGMNWFESVDDLSWRQEK